MFGADWEEVEDSVSGYCNLSEEVVGVLLDKDVEIGGITKCVRKLKNS